MSRRLKIVVLGLSLSSSWGNGHATTYRSLLKALAARGHEILFLERNVPWYAENRDLTNPDYCWLAFYEDLAGLERWRREVASADAVIVGSFTPEGVAVGRWAMEAASGPVAFYDIDTPVTLGKLFRGDVEYLAPEQVAQYDLYLSFTGGPTLTRLERDYGSPAARALYCSADAEIYQPTGAARRWDLSYLGTYSPDRQPVLDRLLLQAARAAPELNFCVAGPQYPRDIEWPANVERLEHVAPADHPDFYSASRFTLNVTRADMVAAGYAPSVRLFEAGACGCPIISDVWTGLDTLFRPEEEIVLAETAEDTLAALRAGDDVRAGLAEGARRRVLDAHTSHHRAETLETELLAAIERRVSRPSAAAASQTPVSTSETLTTMKKKQQRVLVAGGAGFLGSHLCDRLLSEGAQVVCLDNLQTGSLDNLERALAHPDFEFVKADIVDPLPSRLARRRFDRIYNLACAASPPLYQADPEHTLLTSVVGTRHLLQLAETCGARFLLASTSEIYGDPEVHPQPETYWGNVNSTGPRACYDEGKRCAETLSFDFDRAGRGEVRVARIFNTYGPRLSAADGRVVSNLVSQALAEADITVFGDGSQTRSFCYVDDLVGGLIALMEHDGPQPGPVNLGNPTELTVRELVEVILAITGSESEVVFRPLPVDDPRRRRPDISKAADVLGWKPTTPLEQGLKATIAWFDSLPAKPAEAEDSAALSA
ncbi:bifunctional glycosyltransferase/UDP-glucuronate decarboxylase [Phenylobacterium sp.]|uniref:bifunctional glycosyltransferase/UDP-glucuronate decarboxylase n=1 Tax=Phenylobacterium sp. TaxID=1871053 RepID=UPI0035C87EAF